MNTTPLSPALESHFAAFVTIDVPQLARLFPMDRKTIKRHIDAGRLPSRILGCGRKKPHRCFSRADIEAFLTGDNGACPSIATSDRNTFNTSSRSNVVAFTAPRNGTMNSRPARSRPRKSAKRAPSSNASEPSSAPR
ncbi:DNA-binding protein [Bradyrhizobium diazoefficiens]